MNIVLRDIINSKKNKLLFIYAITFFFAIFITINYNKAISPFIISLFIFYILEWCIEKIMSYRVTRKVAAAFTYIFFLSFFITIILFLFPILWKQFLLILSHDLPIMFPKTQINLVYLLNKYPEYFTENQIKIFIKGCYSYSQIVGKKVLSISLYSISNFIYITLHLILIPIITFFLLKDKKKILSFFSSFKLKKNLFFYNIYCKLDNQIGNYIRGKLIEILIVAFLTFILFWYFKMPYALLLSVSVGISVLVPFIGIFLITVPIFFIAYLQWGINSEFTYCLFFYFLIQVIDSNILVPILFSEVINLHPMFILFSILLFGSMWGTIGIFFAIPIAIIIQCLTSAINECKSCEKKIKIHA